MKFLRSRRIGEYTLSIVNPYQLWYDHARSEWFDACVWAFDGCIPVVIFEVLASLALPPLAVVSSYSLDRYNFTWLNDQLAT
jgi:hypothetical protein